MQGNESKNEAKTGNHGGQFTAARDSRNRKIPGLQIRGSPFYGYLRTELNSGKFWPRRFPLTNEEDGQPCLNLAQAKLALEILRGARRENQLPAPGQKPGFLAWKESYLDPQSSLAKKGRTVTLNTKPSPAGSLTLAIRGSTKSPPRQSRVSSKSV